MQRQKSWIAIICLILFGCNHINDANNTISVRYINTLPIAYQTIGNATFAMVIDSGSSYTLIDSSFVVNAGITIYKTNLQLNSIHGKQHIYACRIDNIEWYVTDLSVIRKIDSKIIGIFGIDYLKNKRIQF